MWKNDAEGAIADLWKYKRQDFVITTDQVAYLIEHMQHPGMRYVLQPCPGVR